METLSQCLYAWMEEEDLTVAQLTERLGFKSKTSVFRLLHGQSNYHSCEQACGLLTPCLDQPWQERFRQALRVEKVGLRRYAMFQALNRCFFPEKKGKSFSQSLETGATFPAEGGTVLLLGNPGEAASRLIDDLLTGSEGTRIEHWITLPMLLDRPELLETMIAHMTDLRYCAFLLPEGCVSALPWNVALWTSSAQTYVVLTGSGGITWHPVGAEVAQKVQEALSQLEQIPL